MRFNTVWVCSLLPKINRCKQMLLVKYCWNLMTFFLEHLLTDFRFRRIFLGVKKVLSFSAAPAGCWESYYHYPGLAGLKKNCGKCCNNIANNCNNDNDNNEGTKREKKQRTKFLKGKKDNPWGWEWNSNSLSSLFLIFLFLFLYLQLSFFLSFFLSLSFSFSFSLSFCLSLFILSLL